MDTGAVIMLVIVLGVFAVTVGLLVHTINKKQEKGND
jgi:hypothetical protein